MRIPTDCPECEWAEMKWWEKAKAIAFPKPISFDPGSLIRVAMGIPGKSWYEKHRENWEIGGKEIELQRMLRHVK